MNDMFVGKDELERLKSLRNNVESIVSTIGSLEMEKQQLVSHCIGIRSDLEKQAKDSLVKAGIPEDQIEKYRISLDDGKVQEVPKP